MPGYARPTSIVFAQDIIVIPAGNITASTAQDAIYQLDTIKPQSSAVSASVSNISASVNTLNNNISSVEGVALLGL
jgi:hypothetical protein